MVEMPYRTECIFHLICKPDVITAGREPHGLQIKHAAAAHSALDDVGRQTGFFLPLCCQHDTSQVAAGGVTGKIQSICIPTKLFGVAIYPRDRPAQLIGERIQAVTNVLDPAEVRNDIVSATRNEKLRWKSIVFGCSLLPCTAMNKDMYRRIGLRRRINIQRLNRSSAICKSQWLTQTTSNQRAICPQTVNDLSDIRRIDKLRVSVVEFLLVHIEPDRRSMNH